MNMARNFKSNRRLALAGTALAAICLIANNAWAQGAWPTKPVKIVVPFAPGGTTDILARAIAPELSKAFGQQFIVDNRAGAGGNVGAEVVAKSPGDGYTLLMGTVGTHAINPALYPKMPYDHQKDFVPVTLVAGVPNVLVVNPALAQRMGIKPGSAQFHALKGRVDKGHGRMKAHGHGPQRSSGSQASPGGKPAQSPGNPGKGQQDRGNSGKGQQDKGKGKGNGRG